MRRIFDLSMGQSLWKENLKFFDKEGQEPFYQPGYHQAFQKEDIQVECYFYEDKKGDKVFYPYMRSKVNKEFSDIQGVYGYNGPLVTSCDKQFLENFDKDFEQYCKEQKIIAEFMRINPLLGSHIYTGHLDLKKVNENAVVDLSQSQEDLWMKSYEHCVRKNVNKAKQAGVECRVCEGQKMDETNVKSFINIYRHTMDRNQAGKEYYFNELFFQGLEGGVFYFASLKGMDVSCELVLAGGDHAYSFLGGTLEEAETFRPNNLLKDFLIKDLKRRGFKKYCIGGGRSINDGIFRYKKTFAKNGIVDFFIGTKVYDQEVYEDLCHSWEKKYPEKESTYGNMFMKYKY